MMYEKNLFGQSRYHYKDDHGLRVDAAYDLFHAISLIYFLNNMTNWKLESPLSHGRDRTK
jgi:hypothetical protein